MVMVRTCSKYSFVACRWSAAAVSDVLALLSLVFAADALDAAAVACSVAVVACLVAVLAADWAVDALDAAAAAFVLAVDALPAAALWLAAAALADLSAAAALVLAVSSSWPMRARASASSCWVGMPVTPSRMTPQTSSSARVSVTSAAVMAVEPAGTEIVHRPSSYWLWFCRMSGGWAATAGVPVLSRIAVRLDAVSNCSTTRSTRLRVLSASGTVSTVSSRLQTDTPLKSS